MNQLKVLLVAIIFLNPLFVRSDEVIIEDLPPIEDIHEIEKPIHLKPIGVCAAHPNTHFAKSTQEKLSVAYEALQCGDLDLLLEQVRQVEADVIAQQSQTPRGWCYAAAGCTGGVIYPSIVERGTCNAAGGVSWKQTTPTTGKCVRP